MTRGPDYSGAVVGTLIGLVYKAIGGLGTVWVAFFIFVLLFSTWWAWVIVGILAVLIAIPLVIDGRRTHRAVKAHEQRHREKYGKEPRPWKTHTR